MLCQEQSVTLDSAARECLHQAVLRNDSAAAVDALQMSADAAEFSSDVQYCLQLKDLSVVIEGMALDPDDQQLLRSGFRVIRLLSGSADDQAASVRLTSQSQSQDDVNSMGSGQAKVINDERLSQFCFLMQNVLKQETSDLQTLELLFDSTSALVLTTEQAGTLHRELEHVLSPVIRAATKWSNDCSFQSSVMKLLARLAATYDSESYTYSLTTDLVQQILNVFLTAAMTHKLIPSVVEDSLFAMHAWSAKIIGRPAWEQHALSIACEAFDSIENHPESVSINRLALKTLRVMSTSKGLRDIMQFSEHIIAGSLSRVSQEPDIIVCGLTVLDAIEADITSTSMTEESLSYVIGCMRSQYENPAIQEKSLLLMITLLAHGDLSMHTLNFSVETTSLAWGAGFTALLFSMLEMHMDSVDILVLILRVMSLALASDEGHDAVLSLPQQRVTSRNSDRSSSEAPMVSKGIVLITELMQTHVRIPTVQYEVCCVLISLVSGNEELRAHVYWSGGLKVVLKFLALYQGDRPIQVKMCWLLSFLAKSDIYGPRVVEDNGLGQLQYVMRSAFGANDTMDVELLLPCVTTLSILPVTLVDKRCIVLVNQIRVWLDDWCETEPSHEEQELKALCYYILSWNVAKQLLLDSQLSKCTSAEEKAGSAEVLGTPGPGLMSDGALDSASVDDAAPPRAHDFKLDKSLRWQYLFDSH